MEGTSSWRQKTMGTIVLPGCSFKDFCWIFFYRKSTQPKTNSSHLKQVCEMNILFAIGSWLCRSGSSSFSGSEWQAGEKDRGCEDSNNERFEGFAYQRANRRIASEIRAGRMHVTRLQMLRWKRLRQSRKQTWYRLRGQQIWRNGCWHFAAMGVPPNLASPSTGQCCQWQLLNKHRLK